MEGIDNVKLDDELFRRILRQVGDGAREYDDLDLDDYSELEIKAHLKMLQEDGLFRGDEVDTYGIPYSYRMTAAARRFLSSLRSGKSFY